MYEILLNNLGKTHEISNYTVELCEDGFMVYVNNISETTLKDVSTIRARTEEEARKICNYLHKKGETWIGGGSYKEKTHFNDYKGKTVYFIKDGQYSTSDNYSNYVEFSDFKTLLFTYKKIDYELITDMYGNNVYFDGRNDNWKYDNEYVEKMIEIKDIIVAELKKEYDTLLTKIESGEIYDASLFEDMNILIKNEI